MVTLAQMSLFTLIRSSPALYQSFGFPPGQLPAMAALILFQVGAQGMWQPLAHEACKHAWKPHDALSGERMCCVRSTGTSGRIPRLQYALRGMHNA